MSPAEKLKQYAYAVEKAIDPKAFAFLVSGDDPRSVPSIIKKRTQLGYGVPSEGAGNTKLNPLSASYVLARKGFQKGLVMFMYTKELSQKQTRSFDKKLSKGKSSKGVYSTFKGSYGKLKMAQFKAEGLPELSSNTTPKRSNLTLTGEMLNSIVGVQNGLRFTFFFSNPESDKKARLNKENGRRFFDLSKSERMGLQRQISAIMRESLRALFK
jgi:hypothetical protein